MDDAVTAGQSLIHTSPALAPLIHGSTPELTLEIQRISPTGSTAWNAGDEERYARRSSPDVSSHEHLGMVNVAGRGVRGAPHRDPVDLLQRHDQGAGHPSIRFLTTDVAVVDIDNEVRGVKSLPDGLRVPADGVVKTQLMEVFVRRDGGWQMEAYHNVDLRRPRPGKPRPGRSGAARSISTGHTQETRNR